METTDLDAITYLDAVEMSKRQIGELVMKVIEKMGRIKLEKEILDILEQGTPAKTTVYDIGKYISGELNKGINENETE